MPNLAERTHEAVQATVTFFPDIKRATREVYGVKPVFDEEGKVIDAKIDFIAEQSSKNASMNELLLERANEILMDIYATEFFQPNLRRGPFDYRDGWQFHYQDDKPGLQHAYRDRVNPETGQVEKVTVVKARPELSILEDALMILAGKAMVKAAELHMARQ